MWLPLTVSALESLSSAQLPPCCVMFSGDAAVAARVEAWQEKNSFKALHVTTIESKSSTAASDFNLDVLRDYCLGRLEQESEQLNEGQRELVAMAAVDWRWPDVVLRVMTSRVTT